MLREVTLGTCVLALALGGCLGEGTLKELSSPRIGCRESQIAISEDSGPIGNSRTWVATCKGRRFICGGPASGPTTCKKELKDE